VDAVLPITSIADPVVTSAASRPSDSPAKIHDAAQQFEALLLAQMLRSERESGNGWLGSGGDLPATAPSNLPNSSSPHCWHGKAAWGSPA